LDDYSLLDVEVSIVTLSSIEVYESAEIIISSVRHFTTLAHVGGYVG
jgi:hypothetical protein